MVAELSTGPCLALEVKYRKDGRGVEEDVGVEVPKKDGKVCLEETENGAKKRGKEYWDKRHMLLRNYIGPPDPVARLGVCVLGHTFAVILVVKHIQVYINTDT